MKPRQMDLSGVAEFGSAPKKKKAGGGRRRVVSSAADSIKMAHKINELDKVAIPMVIKGDGIQNSYVAAMLALGGWGQ